MTPEVWTNLETLVGLFLIRVVLPGVALVFAVWSFILARSARSFKTKLPAEIMGRQDILERRIEEAHTSILRVQRQSNQAKGVETRRARSGRRDLEPVPAAPAQYQTQVQADQLLVQQYAPLAQVQWPPHVVAAAQRLMMAEAQQRQNQPGDNGGAALEPDDDDPDLTALDESSAESDDAEPAE